MMPRGFSIATRGTCSSSVNWRKNLTASSWLPSACHLGNHRVPVVVSRVHGGKAMTMSQSWSKRPVTSPWICWPGLSVGRMSHEVASQPRAVKASRTLPLYSQATRTRPLLFDDPAIQGLLSAVNRSHLHSDPVLIPEDLGHMAHDHGLVIGEHETSQGVLD